MPGDGSRGRLRAAGPGAHSLLEPQRLTSLCRKTRVRTARGGRTELSCGERARGERDGPVGEEAGVGCREGVSRGHCPVARSCREVTENGAEGRPPRGPR